MIKWMGMNTMKNMKWQTKAETMKELFNNLVAMRIINIF